LERSLLASSKRPLGAMARSKGEAARLLRGDRHRIAWRHRPLATRARVRAPSHHLETGGGSFAPAPLTV
jgi:hypothetical protein